ncbi:MAG: hypothetical protein JO147_08200 [Actinobacteria bacterium]|nr:hypothetical protein [Actinomycetota bacterium]
MWTFAAVLILPIGLVSLVIAITYGCLIIRGWLTRSACLYRLAFSAATTLLGAYAAQLTSFAIGGEPLQAHDATYSSIPVTVAMLVAYSGTSLAASVVATSLYREHGRVRDALPAGPTLVDEAISLLVGVVTAAVVVHEPYLAPIMLVVAATAHRGSVAHPPTRPSLKIPR